MRGQLEPLDVRHKITTYLGVNPNRPSMELNYRQRQAVAAIERAATDFDVMIRVHVPDGEVADRAHTTVRALEQALKAEIIAEK